MNEPLSFRVPFRLFLLPVLLVALLFPAVIQPNGQAAAGDLRTVQVSAPAGTAAIISDDFNACGIAGCGSCDECTWPTVYAVDGASAFIPPEEAFSGNSRLHIYVPGGSKHTISGEQTNAPRVEQCTPDADFLVEAKFESELSEGYQMQGILIDGEESKEYIRFEFHHDGTDLHIYAGINSSSGVNAVHNIIDPDPGPIEAYYIRVQRSGNYWTHSYSYDGIDWTPVEAFQYVMHVEKLGVFAGNSGGNPEHTALVDYFFNVASPIEDEDGDRNELNVTVVPDDQGHYVVKSPDKTSYDCWEAATMTAFPADHWYLAYWSGDIEGISDPDGSPASVAMTGSRDITANFALDEYTLTVNTVGNGVVEKDPDQQTYQYGTEVELTAVPDPGHILSAWSGDLTGDDNPTTISMTQDRTVTATFVEGTYTLDVNVAPGGAGGSYVSIAPDKPGGYDHGDVVTLTAFPATGWSFAQWGGDATGTDNPKIITITQNTDITANFVQGGLTLTINIDGGGHVEKDPDEPVYLLGAEVDVTAYSDPGWIFSHWSGDLTGTDNPKHITMFSSVLATAHFVEAEQVFMPLVVRDK